jgi:hypothetical protein
MIKVRFFSTIFILYACALPAAGQQTQPAKPVSYNNLLPWFGKGAHVPATKEGEAKVPFQIFDNVYYVGPQSASTYIIKTDQGLILIDPTFDYFVDSIVDNIRAIGLNPKDVKYILISHGHWDHTAGVAGMQKATGAKVGMAAGDWDIYETPDPNHTFERIPRDLVMKEGDVIELGNTTVQLYVTPGHTPGCLTMVYTVYDHQEIYRKHAENARRSRRHGDAARPPGNQRYFRFAAEASIAKAGRPEPIRHRSGGGAVVVRYRYQGRAGSGSSPDFGETAMTRGRIR